VDKAKFGETR